MLRLQLIVRRMQVSTVSEDGAADYLKLLLMTYAGRAIAIQPEGLFDLKDDLASGWGGDQLRPIMERRREAGFDA